MSRRPALVAAVLAAFLAGCDRAEEPAAEPVRPVRVVAAEFRPGGETATLTGAVRAEETVALAFRTGGRVLERNANLGDMLKGGEVVARLDPETQRNALAAARAEEMGALGERDRTEADYERQRQLLERGFTTRQRYDLALQAMRAARARVDVVAAQVANAEEALGFTELTADAPGVVTAVGAEPGEVVAAGQMMLTLAREGGRDAVFDAPERLLARGDRGMIVTVTLASDPSVTTQGRVREVAPKADAATRTFEVRVGLIDPPEAMRLGATVVGSVTLAAGAGVELPAPALTAADGRPAVFVFDAAAGAVVLRPVTVASYGPATVLVAEGLAEGDLVVTAGVQALRPGQRVRIAGAN